MREATKNLLLFIISSLICIFVVEIGLRIAGFSYPALFEPDHNIGWKHRPNSEGTWRSEGDAYIRINKEGFRDLERSTTKPPGTLRIAVLGDSFADALQVDLSETFWRRLEYNLKDCTVFESTKVEVLNFGISGFGTLQELLTFQSYASKYDPDIVLLALTVRNDIINNSATLETNKNRPFPILLDGEVVADMSFRDSDQFKRRSSTAYRFFRRLLDLRIAQAISAVRVGITNLGTNGKNVGRKIGSERGLNDQVFLEPDTIAWNEAWHLTEAIIDQLNVAVKEYGASLFIATLSSGIQVHPDPLVRHEFMSNLGVEDLFYPDRRIEKISSMFGIRHIILSPIMVKIAEDHNLFFHGFPNTKMGIGHWNKNGHRVGAELIAGSMCQQFGQNTDLE